MPILVEGRVGIVESGGDNKAYIQALKDAGALGAIIGGGMAIEEVALVVLDRFMRI